MDAVAGLTLADGAATLAAFTVQSVARSREHLRRAPLRWLVTGGGRHNGTLMALLRDALGAVDPVEAVGWDGDALEALGQPDRPPAVPPASRRCESN